MLLNHIDMREKIWIEQEKKVKEKKNKPKIVIASAAEWRNSAKNRKELQEQKKKCAEKNWK